MKKILFTTTMSIAIAFGLTGCAELETSKKSAKAAPVKSAEQVAYESTLGAAKAERKKAKAAGGEWRDIGKFLKKADAAAKKGDYKKAQKLAAKAKFQAGAGQRQMSGEAGRGNASYVY
jgi:hypothetical protein